MLGTQGLWGQAACPQLAASPTSCVLGRLGVDVVPGLPPSWAAEGARGPPHTPLPKTLALVFLVLVSRDIREGKEGTPARLTPLGPQGQGLHLPGGQGPTLTSKPHYGDSLRPRTGTPQCCEPGARTPWGWDPGAETPPVLGPRGWVPGPWRM